MIISIDWLQKYFETPLPSADAIADAFTFHAFEIDEVAGGRLDVKVLPNRAADCLCHRGIARELAAILDRPMKRDPLREPTAVSSEDKPLSVIVDDAQKCPRYMGALVRGVKIGPSPAWLRAALESVGQRSINNVVDATNYVMLDIGQPLHAFDAARLREADGTYHVRVRQAKAGEKITVLGGKEYTLADSMLIIADGTTDAPVGIAGIKGGAAAELTPETTDIIIESANFDGPTVRRAAQKLKLFTDASLRFQNRPSPELCAYGMRDALALITQVAGGEVEGVIDRYPARPTLAPVSVSFSRINGILGSDFSREEILDVFARLGLDAAVRGEECTITPPFERTDLALPEDLVEEIGRTLGYDRIAPRQLTPPAAAPDQAAYRGIERVKDFLVGRGFIEISTQSFAKKGDIVLANPLDQTRPALRANLADNMRSALAQAKLYAALVLAPNQKPKLFEIGTVFTKEGERTAIETSEAVAGLPALQDDARYVPQPYCLGPYRPFSAYPFIVRDVAMWAPAGTDQDGVLSAIKREAGALCVRIDLFDRFEKDGRTSLAYRLVFQSFERTLEDADANAIMEKIYAVLRARGFEIR